MADIICLKLSVEYWHSSDRQFCRMAVYLLGSQCVKRNNGGQEEQTFRRELRRQTRGHHIDTLSLLNYVRDRKMTKVRYLILMSQSGVINYGEPIKSWDRQPSGRSGLSSIFDYVRRKRDEILSVGTTSRVCDTLLDSIPQLSPMHYRLRSHTTQIRKNTTLVIRDKFNLHKC